VLGVRQYFPDYLRGRVSTVLRPGIGVLGHALELEQRRRARGLPAIVVGADLARRYREGGGPVLEIAVSLIRPDDVMPVEEALARPWDGELRVLTVTRLDAEKNPLLLADVLGKLRAGDERWRLTVAGVGPLRRELEQRAAELGVAGALELAGYVPAGPELWRLYRESTAFLHVSLTEGVPQVLLEAQAAGLPIVATDVGGVRDALGGGGAGLLVPPRDAEAAAGALRRLEREPELRRRLVASALERASQETLDAQLDRVVDFLGDTIRPGRK
jgi:glycosyltransferase involved in cell wall biosynthesis